MGTQVIANETARITPVRLVFEERDSPRVWFEEHEKGIIEEIPEIRTLSLREPEAGRFSDVYDQRKWFIERKYWPFEGPISEEEDILLFRKFLKAWDYSWYRTENIIGHFEVEDPANPQQKNFEKFRELMGDYKIA